MKKRYLLILGTIVLVVVLGKSRGCEAIEKIYQTRAVKARVEAVLQGIQLNKDGKGTVGDEQLALCRWYADVGIPIGDLQELGKAADAFDSWRKEGNIFPYINYYTITEVKLEETGIPGEPKPEGRKEEKKPSVFIVTGTIDGARFIMRVPEGDTISWIQAPW